MASKFDSLVSQKSVALIGGSDSIEWDEVNKCDLVARVNGHWARQGGRCEVLYYSCADDLDYRMWSDPELWKQLKFAVVNLSHRLFGGYAGEKTNWVISQLIEHCVPIETYVSAPHHAWQVFKVLQEQPQSWSRDLAARYDFHPLTGILAVEHLLLSKAASVYVTGMTLYQQPSGQMPTDAGRHTIAPQIEFLRDAAKWSRLQLSPRLKQILELTA